MILLFFHQPAVHRDGDHLPRNELPALLECLFRRHLQPAVAGYLHADDGDALDVILPDDFGQLFGVVDAVKLWTSAQSYFTMDKVLMEAAVCVSGTVGSDQKFGIVEIRGADRG